MRTLRPYETGGAIQSRSRIDGGANGRKKKPSTDRKNKHAARNGWMDGRIDRHTDRETDRKTQTGKRHGKFVTQTDDYKFAVDFVV